MIIILKMKHGDYPVYARDDAEKDRAWLHLFNLLDGHGYYTPDSLDGDEVAWCEEARQGNAQSAAWLLDCHSRYEYEGIEIVYPLEP